MNVSFFHQAHLNNWHAYRQSLEGGRGVLPWDDVVLTAANERQAQAYRHQLELRRGLGLLPGRTRFHVVPDPDGRRIGSGGATLHVLQWLARACGGDAAELLHARRVLLVHSGGDSRRLPQYSAFGKVFAPIPRLLVSGRPSTLFDELFAALIGLPARMNPGLVTAAGDVLLLFDHSQIEMSRPGVTGLAIPVNPETAQRHGVFVAAEGGKVRAFLHKPDAQTLAAESAVLAGNVVPVDTGIVYVAPDVAARLHDAAFGARAWMRRVLDGGVALNFYGDFLAPLAPGTARDAFVRNTSDGPATPELRALRQDMWDVLRGTPFFVELLTPAKFLHFGTAREYQRLVTVDDEDIRALGGRRRISHVRGADVQLDEHTCILHSALGDGASVRSGSVVEFSEIGADSVLAGECLVSNVRLPPGTKVPTNTVVHGLPVREAGNDATLEVVRLWAIDDNPKAALPVGTFLGKPLTAWLDEWHLAPEALWPDATVAAQRTLWTARLFPAATTTADAWHAVAWLLEAETTAPHPPPAWLAAPRHSLQSSYEQADLDMVARRQEELFANLVFHKCRDMFRREQAVDEWFERIPTAYDLNILTRRMAAECLDDWPALERVRWHGSIAALLRRHPNRTALNLSAVDFEETAFRGLAEGMLHTHRARVSRVQRARAQWRQPNTDVRLPVRLDFGGGWSDTPPHTLERGGTVLNAAVLLDGERPVRVLMTRLDQPLVRLASDDLQVAVDIDDLGALGDYGNPLDPLAIHKAAFSLFALGNETPSTTLAGVLEHLGGGIEVRTDVRVPKGSGLGTSSVLAAGLAKAFSIMTAPSGHAPTLDDLLRAASAIEQMLTTGGGWQDQVGGLCPGLKVTRVAPGFEQELQVEPVALPPERRRELDARLVLIDTGQRRLARNLLREIMGDWLARRRVTVRVLEEIQTIALDIRDAFEAGDFARIGRLMTRHWELNKELDGQTSNEFIETLIGALRPYLEGAKLAGAGGGGFLFGIAKSGAGSAIDDLLQREFAGTNVRRHATGVAWDGQ